jgi:hypothetical protein
MYLPRCRKWLPLLVLVVGTGGLARAPGQDGGPKKGQRRRPGSGLRSGAAGATPTTTV